MRVIDSHVHLYPPEANVDPARWGRDRGEDRWVEMSTRIRKTGIPVQAFPSVDELLSEMDRAGVERSILVGWYWQRAATCTAQNRFFADCIRAHPDRLSALATVQVADGVEGALAEMKSAHDTGLIGLGELSPHTQGYAATGANSYRVLDYASELRWPVNFHVTDPMSRDYPGRVETPLEDFVSIARAFPRLRIILAHWGGLLPLRDVTAKDLPNLYYDTAASPLLYDPSVWERALAVISSDRVLFGSDFPLNLFPKLERSAEMTRFLQEARTMRTPAAVLANNAIDVFGVP
ncbi:MAG: amidohydrolase family protein [Opitutus sp.]